MASRSPSRSEGEVLSSDSEANLKANTSRSSRKKAKVDRTKTTALVAVNTALAIVAGRAGPGPALEVPAALEVPLGSLSVPDESAVIEERRKRREAIKNKYRGQGTPLLVQALHSRTDTNTAADNTPALDSAGSSPGQSDQQLSKGTTGQSDQQLSKGATASATRHVSPFADSPQSPALLPRLSPAGSASPKAEDWTNGGDVASPAEDGPSAADYDPTIDMQEEPPPANPKADVKLPQTLDAGMMDNWDDHEGYYVTILGELIDNRYQVTQNLGRGMFSSVVRATDSHTSQVVAIKIVRSNESMRKAGLKEIDILRDLAASDPEDRKHVIRLLRSFDHKGHLCMVFENLSMNLREVLKKFGRDVGINLKAIRAYAQQLFLGLGLLKRCQYLHADLKPDNILVNEARNLLKICDLGSASSMTENATAPYLVSRFYRAPEVILGIPYDYGIDMWSIGCTLFELYTGKILFTGRNNNTMLKAIMDCRGKFPHKLLRRGALTYDHFDDLLNFKAEEADKVTGRIVTKLVDIKAKPVRDLRSRLLPRDKRVDETERREVEMFLDLLDKCLDLRPEKRMTPNEALKHPFISRTKP
ncbi:hypothetical protein DV737_g2874, partial [Chaetothyriales sp. CBS 132003]